MSAPIRSGNMDEMQDLRERAAAYRDGPAPERPTSEGRLKYKDFSAPLIWTPEWVVLRMEFGFEVLLATAGRVGPCGFAAIDLSKHATFSKLALAEKQAYDELVEAKQEEALSTPPNFTPYDMACADESLSWPARHLADERLMRDAIMLYCLSLATGRPTAPLLRARKLQAAAIARQMEARENGQQSAARYRLARATAIWANGRIDGASSDDQVKAIKANARIRFERAVRKAGLCGASVKPHEAMPGLILAPSTLDKYRKLAAALLCERLREASIPVR